MLLVVVGCFGSGYFCSCCLLHVVRCTLDFDGHAAARGAAPVSGGDQT